MGRGQNNDVEGTVARAGLTISLPRREQGFWVTEQEGLRLIHPTQGQYRWAPEERRFRSLIVDAQGRVVSEGYPKFFNAGEEAAAEDAKRLVDEIQAGGEVYAEEKVDGSLIIR